MRIDNFGSSVFIVLLDKNELASVNCTNNFIEMLALFAAVKQGIDITDKHITATPVFLTRSLLIIVRITSVVFSSISLESCTELISLLRKLSKTGTVNTGSLHIYNENQYTVVVAHESGGSTLSVLEQYGKVETGSELTGKDAPIIINDILTLFYLL